MNYELPLETLKSRVDDGQRLDVAGLNEITVLIDRSQTALTEVGLNRWYSGLEGPPHFHESKEQIFYIIDGTATITVGGDSYRVRPGDLIYVPPGTMHRTVVDEGGELIYLLFNAFTDGEKEGHSSFADHIAKVKQVRRRQAEDAKDGAAVDWVRSDRRGVHIPAQSTKAAASAPEHQSFGVRSLLAAGVTFRCSAEVIYAAADGQWPYEAKVGMQAERTLYLVKGHATIWVDGKAWPLDMGDLLYVPPGRNVTVQTSDGGLELLSLYTFLDAP